MLLRFDFETWSVIDCVIPFDSDDSLPGPQVRPLQRCSGPWLLWNHVLRSVGELWGIWLARGGARPFGARGLFFFFLGRFSRIAFSLADGSASQRVSELAG